MTFIVDGNFVVNATLLDSVRLAKQRVEAHQILSIIQKGGAWENHPIVKAWRPFPDALKYYINCIIQEFIRRGGHNNLALFEIPPMILMPWWASWDRLHQSHRVMLIRKNPFWYTDKFSVQPEYQPFGYIWPAEIAYDKRDAPLAQITAPIPKELINPVYCSAVMGNGQICHRLVKKGVRCGIHNK